MKLYKTDAIVLGVISLKDANQLLVLYSREYGKIRAMAYGVLKPTSRKRGAVQPFCYSRFLINKGREIDSISQCEGLETYPNIGLRLDWFGYASYFAELVENLTFEGVANKDIFKLLIEAFRLIGQSDIELLARAFEIKLITLLGYKPVLEYCVNCCRALSEKRLGFSFALGGVLCASCVKESSLKCHLGTIQTLKLMLRWDLSRLDQLKVDVRARKELWMILKTHIDYHLGYGCRALQFLERFFGNA